MHVHYIEAENFKGRSFAHDLAPLTLIVGDNFDGKTAIAEALGIGLLGYTPLLGKRNMDTFKLATGNKMRIRLATESASFEHSWRQTETGIKYEKKMPFETPSVLLDLREYLYETTSAQRVAAIFEKINMSKFSDESLRQKLEKLEALPAAVAEPIISGLLEQFDASLMSRDKRQVSVQGWIGSLIEDWKDRKRHADNAANLASGAIVAARRAVESVPGLPKDRSGELTEARQLQKELGGIEAGQEAWKRSKARREVVEAEIARMGGKRSDLAQEASKLEKAIAGYKSTSEALRADCEAKRGDFRAAQEKLNAAKRQIATAAAEIKAVEAHEYCPFCKDNAKGWQGRVVAELVKRKASLEKEAKAEQSTLTKADGKKLRAELDKAEAADAADAEKQAALCGIQAQMSLQAELEAMGGSEPDGAKLEAIKQKLDALLKQIAEAQAETDAFKTRKQFKDAAAAKEVESVQKQTEAKLLKAAVECLVETQREMVAEAFDKLLKKSRWFTDGILRSPLCYRDGELGRLHDDGTFIHHQVFSGTEQLLAYAGISIALAQEAPLKLVRLDEMGRLTPANKKRVVERLAELIAANRIDQAIIIDADQRDYGCLESRSVKPFAKVIKV